LTRAPQPRRARGARSPGRFEWDPEVAEQLAERLGIAPLKHEHWQVIAACREEAARTRRLPTLPRIQELTGHGAAALAHLFEGRVEILIALVAGLADFEPVSREPGRRGAHEGGGTG